MVSGSILGEGVAEGVQPSRVERRRVVPVLGRGRLLLLGGGG
ncbi:MAG: hypothetical protein BMS9Abin29_1257 [Gemmatimonadota bacterium]|nr:MAG: hypothetical protein BMS9Abin29_1257 [Gemmatimonadota bacterium]